MGFDHLPPSKPAPRRARNAPIFCAGWRVFIHWPRPDEHLTNAVPLTDGIGNVLINDFADGQIVEIVAWQPRSREGLLYQVRRVTDGTEGWIEAHCLRREALAPACGEVPTIRRR